MNQEAIYGLIRKMIQTEISNLGLLQGEWHLGKVDGVVDNKKLHAFIDGSSTSQLIASNPDVSFQPLDEIYVVYINGDSKNKFALCRRAV